MGSGHTTASPHAPDDPGRPPPRGLVVAACLVPLAAAMLAFSGSLAGDWVFDDVPVFVENRALAHGDWWSLAFGSVHTALANRPLPCWTFAVNPTFGASRVFDLRLGNLVLHALNALLVLGVIRRTLLARNLAGFASPAKALWLATAVASLWACHPLTVDAVAYVTQRSTLLMTGFLLTALYGVLRHADTGRWHWRALTLLALVGGMASKEDFVGAPALVILFERAFLVPSWTALARHRRWHVACATTWAALVFCVTMGPSNPTVGFAAMQKVTAIEWLQTQAPVVLHYLRLVVWPYPQKGAYDVGIEHDLAPALLPMLAVAALLVWTALQWRVRPWLGWLGAMFFLLLGPTSSVMPIVTEVVAERRMYLPMLAVLAPLVIAAAGKRLLPATAPARAAWSATAALFAAVVAAAIVRTRAQAAVYRDPDTFWSAAFAANELTNGSLVSSIVLGTRAQQLQMRGQRQEALRLLERAMRCEARMERLPISYAGLLRELGRLDDCERVLRALVAERADLAAGHALLALVLVDRHEADLAREQATPKDPRLVEAVREATRARQLAPDAWNANVLGTALCRQGRYAEAEAALLQALDSDPRSLDARRTLGEVRCLSGHLTEGIEQWRVVLAAAPDDHGLRASIARAQLQAGDRSGALATLREWARLQPRSDDAKRMLEELETGRR